MQAALFYGKQDIRVEKVPKPRISDREVLLDVHCAFICGTDVRMIQNGHTSTRMPLVLGHELSGTISAVGKHVRGYTEGMRVTVAPNMGCGTCDLCISGNTHLCPDYQALGIHVDGGFAEYVRIPAPAVEQGNIYELPEQVSFENAALAEPFSCVYNGFERAQIGPGDVVLVIGAGPIGIMHAKLAKMAGASSVILNDLLAERLEPCRKSDASFILHEGVDIKDRIMELTNGRGVDVCITACPAPAAQVTAIELAAINGRIVFFGGLPKDRADVVLNTNLIHYKQLIVTGTTRSSLRQYRKTLDLIAGGLVSVSDLVTSKFHLSDINQALDCAAKGVGLKNLIDCSNTSAE